LAANPFPAHGEARACPRQSTEARSFPSFRAANFPKIFLRFAAADVRKSLHFAPTEWVFGSVCDCRRK